MTHYPPHQLVPRSCPTESPSSSGLSGPDSSKLGFHLKSWNLALILPQRANNSQEQPPTSSHSHPLSRMAPYPPHQLVPEVAQPNSPPPSASSFLIPLTLDTPLSWYPELGAATFAKGEQVSGTNIMTGSAESAVRSKMDKGKRPMMDEEVHSRPKRFKMTARKRCGPTAGSPSNFLKRRRVGKGKAPMEEEEEDEDEA